MYISRMYKCTWNINLTENQLQCFTTPSRSLHKFSTTKSADQMCKCKCNNYEEHHLFLTHLTNSQKFAKKKKIIVCPDFKVNNIAACVLPISAEVTRPLLYTMLPCHDDS